MRLEKYLKREQCGNPMTVENHETVERALGRNLVRLERKAKAMRTAQLNRRDRIDALPTGSPLDGLYPKKRMKFNTISKKPLILTEMPKPEIPDVSPAAIFRESELAEEEEEDPPRPISRPEPIVAAMPPLPVLPPILGEAATMQISSQAVDAQPNSLPPQVVDARPKSLQSQVADASPISPPTQVVDAQPISPPTQVVDAQPISLPTQVVDAPPISLPLQVVVAQPISLPLRVDDAPPITSTSLVVDTSPAASEKAVDPSPVDLAQPTQLPDLDVLMSPASDESVFEFEKFFSDDLMELIKVGGEGERLDEESRGRVAEQEEEEFLATRPIYPEDWERELMVDNFIPPRSLHPLEDWDKEMLLDELEPPPLKDALKDPYLSSTSCLFN